MSDANPYDYIWRLWLDGACLVMKASLGGGVRHEIDSGIETSGQANGLRGVAPVSDVRSGVLGDSRDHEGINADNDRKIIDLSDYRARRALRDWARATGFGIRGF